MAKSKRHSRRSPKKNAQSNKADSLTRDICCVIGCDEKPTRKCDRCDRIGCETHIIEKRIIWSRDEYRSESFTVLRCPVCERIAQEIDQKRTEREHKIAVFFGLFLLIIFVGAAVLDWLGVPLPESF